MKKKFVIIVFFIIVLVIIGINYWGQNKMEKKNANEKKNTIINETKEVNVSENLKQEKMVANLKITDIMLEREETTTKFMAIVHNNTEYKFAGSDALVKFLNEDGSIYYELYIYIPEINSNDIGEINTALPEDITSAYDFEILLINSNK